MEKQEQYRCTGRESICVLRLRRLTKLNIRVCQTIEKFNMINHGDNIIVGLSGGADSVSLAHFLANYNERNNVNVIAAHVNHCIRGEEADRDEEFVKNFCEKLGIDLYVKE